MIADNFRTQLNENKFYFGPNTKALLNFWIVLDRLPERMTREQLGELARQYTKLKLNSGHSKPLLTAWELQEDLYINHYDFRSIYHCCELELWLYWASLEICFIQKLFESGQSLIFPPKLIQQLEHYDAL